MKIFEVMRELSCEQVIFCYNKATNLKAIIALHDTTLGPALGGCRLFNYSSEEDAIMDVVRLARGMTLKSSMAGVDLGGGKSVIWADPQQKSEQLLRAMGRFIETLNGRYITGNDMNTEPKDLAVMKKETQHLVSLPEAIEDNKDSSWMTAYGVFCGIRACVEDVFKTNNLSKKTVAIQGAGKVGKILIEMLAKEGVDIVVSDPDKERVIKLKKDFNCKIVDPNDIYDTEVDIFSPCAIGATINDKTIPKLKCKIIAGSANNQLSEARNGKDLYDKGILYAPDFVINAGGLIHGYTEFKKESQKMIVSIVEQIYFTLKKIFSISKEKNIPPNDVAELLAMERIESIGKIKRIYINQ